MVVATVDWIGALAGAVIGFLLALLADATRGPRLTFAPQIGTVDGPLAHTDGRQFRLLHVLVTNERRPWWGRWRDRTANYARCFVDFKDPDTGLVIRRIDGRWASGREPYDHVAKTVDWALVTIPQREILPIGETFPVNIALKFEGHDQFYAFNNQSYLPADDDPAAWCHRDKRFEQDHLLVTVEIQAEGLLARSPDFLIRHPNASLAAFSIA